MLMISSTTFSPCGNDDGHVGKQKKTFENGWCRLLLG
jgi:hypothetical protein